MSRHQPPDLRGHVLTARCSRAGSRRHRKHAGLRLLVEYLELRRVLSTLNPSDTVFDLPTDPTVQRTGWIADIGGRDVYQVPIDGDGRLVATAHAEGVATRLSLLDDQGHVLIESEAISRSNADNRIDQHVPAGTYYLAVRAISGIGSFTLTTSFTSTNAPYQALEEGSGSFGVASADLNGDHTPDLIVSDFYNNRILINFGTDDGTFRSSESVSVGAGPTGITPVDLNGDGIVDLAIADRLSNDVTILVGHGDGTFQNAGPIPTGTEPTNVATGDFDRDGKLDVAVAEQTGNRVEIFRGNGDGAFAKMQTIESMNGACWLAAADYNADGQLDLAVACKDAGSVVLLTGRGDGTFSQREELPVGAESRAVVAADFNGDGLPDLAAVSTSESKVGVFLNAGNGSFAAPTWLAAGSLPYALLAGDLCGDGHIDLAVCNRGSNDASVFRGRGDGTFQSPVTVVTGNGPSAVTTEDFNADGRPDLATVGIVGTTVSVLMNTGNGSFHSPPRPPVNANPYAVKTADLNGDGILDLVVPNYATNDVSILIGRGDGSFREPTVVPVGSAPEDVAIGDYNGDGIVDLAITNGDSFSISILIGNGGGQFRLTNTLATNDAPTYIHAVDLDGDGHLDLVAANFLAADVSVFYGAGDGTFARHVVYPVGQTPSGVTIGDLNEDGRPDIVVSDVGSNDVEVLLANGPRSFAPAISYFAGYSPYSVSAADFNGDGYLDLVVAAYTDTGRSAVMLLDGVGDGTFRTLVATPAGSSFYPLAVADFDDNGTPDVILGDGGMNDLSLLLGQGDGSFGSEIRLASGHAPYGLAVGDFNGDGHLDVASANSQSNDVTVDLGHGDGTFTDPITVSLTSTKASMVTADFNGDGRLDAAVTDPAAGTITIRAGQGDGTFGDGTTIHLGGHPSALLATDVNNDGRLDLAVTDKSAGAVLILYGLGDGTFRDPVSYAVGQSPEALVTADFNGDGFADLAIEDTGSNDIAVLYGVGDGSFRSGPKLAVGVEPIALVAEDLNGDGRPDLVAANRTSGDLTFVWNTGNGHFRQTTWHTDGVTPSELVASDLSGDGIPDVVVADALTGRAEGLLGLGGGRFASPVALQLGPDCATLLAADLDGDTTGIPDLIVGHDQSLEITIWDGWTSAGYSNRTTIPVGAHPDVLAVGDFNEDGRPDFATLSATTIQTSVLLGLGYDAFLASQIAVPLPHAAPLISNNLGDGTPGAATVGKDGQILIRFEHVGSPGEFDPPVNVTAGTDGASREVANITTARGAAFASLDRHSPVIVVARVGTGGDDLVFVPLPAGRIYTRMCARDLNGDGLDDLAVLDRASNEVLIYVQRVDGSFLEDGDPIPTGSGPTDLLMTDLDRDGWIDLVVANGSSGDVSIFHGLPGVRFGPELRVRAGLDFSNLVVVDGVLQRCSQDEPVSLASGVFDSSGMNDIVVAQRGADRISILKSTLHGGYADPSLSTSYTTGQNPTQVVAARLSTGGPLDLIVLNEGSQDISVFRNNGDGGFATLPRVDAGNHPTGFTVRDVNGDGIADLAVSNDNGDLLILIGKGDGTLQPYRRADNTVDLAVGDLLGNGQTDFVLSNTSLDELSVQFPQSSASFLQGRADGLRAPGPAAIADMDGNGIPDLVVVNSGGNDVLVYLGLGGGRFAATRQFFTGTAPQGLTIADLNGDAIPDLVVTNAGSNDVSILLGTKGANGWTLEPGLRLNVGQRPVATTVCDVDGNGVADILCVNQDSNSVTLLRGLGGGFFDDHSPRVFAAAQSPIRAFVGHFSPGSARGLVILNSLSNDMTYYADVTATDLPPATIPTGGLGPVAGVAGDFNHDGFADIVIANRNDSRITLFYGGPLGPMLARSVLLAGGNGPTGLAVSVGKQNDLQLFVSTEGLGRVLSVSFNTVVSSPVAAPTLPSFGQSLVADLGRSPASESTNSTPSLNTPLIQETASLATPQIASSAQAVAVVSSAGGAAGLAGVVGMISQVVQPLFSSSIGSLTWLIDNLVQMEQAQTWDILPIGESDMVAVAVILPGVNPLDPSVAASLPATLDSSEAEETAAVTTPPSAVDRFLSDVDGALAHLFIDVGEDTILQSKLGAEWVWQQQGGALPALAFSPFASRAPGSSGIDARAPVMRSMSTSDVVASDDVTNPLANRRENNERRTRAEDESQSPRLLTFSICLLAVSSALLLWRRYGRSFLSCWKNRLSRAVLTGAGTFAPKRPSRKTPVARGRSIQDLPPWLQGSDGERCANGELPGKEFP